MTLSKRRNAVAFLKFSKSFKHFLEFFRVFNRDGFNFCPVAMFYCEVIDNAVASCLVRSPLPPNPIELPYRVGYAKTRGKCASGLELKMEKPSFSNNASRGIIILTALLASYAGKGSITVAVLPSNSLKCQSSDTYPALG